MKILKKTIILSSMLLAFCSNAQKIPYIGDESSKLWSKTKEADIGKASYNHLLSQGRIINDAQQQDYLEDLGYKISTYANTRVGLNFFLTNSTSINAFASLGGYVGINAGLVLATDNEHELAGVLAHEITHVSQEHIARLILAVKDRQLANAAALIAGVLVASKTSSSGGAGIIKAVIANETQQQLNDIRSHEQEADRIGKNLMQKAGFNKLGMQTFFAKLYSPSYINQAPSYLLTHPLPRDRVMEIDDLKQTKHKKLKSSDEYYLFKARIRVSMLSFNELNTTLENDLKDSNSQIKNAYYYAKSLAELKTGKIKSAISQLNKLNSRFSKKRDILLLKAKLALLSSKNKQASSIYKSLWKRFKNDSVVAYDYAMFLNNNNNNFKKTTKILKKQYEIGSRNPDLYYLYAEALLKTGQVVQQQQVLIDFYQLSGEYSRAKAQVTIALSNKSLTWKQRSQLESKKQEIEQIIKLKKGN